MKKIVSIFCLTALFFCVSLFMTGAYAETIQVVKEPVFEDIKIGASTDLCLMIKKDGYWGYADKDGNEMIECVYDSVNAFSEGIALVEKDGKYGFINEVGTIIVPIEYDSAYSFSEGLAAVKKEDRWGYINNENVVVIPFIYDTAESFSEGVAVTKEKTSESTVISGFISYVIDKTGKVCFSTKAIVMGPFYNGLAQFGYDGTVGLISKTGREFLSPKYICIYDFCDSIARIVNTGGKYGFIDETGKEIVPCEYDYALDFSEGIGAVNKDDKWGYIDDSGTIIIPFEYDSAWSFSEGLADVEKDGKWGFINQSGEEIINFIYDNTGSFSEGLAPVQKDGKWGFVNQLGEEVINFIYDGAGSFSEGLARVKKDGKWGYVNKNEDLITPFIYDSCTDISGNIGFIQMDGLWGIVKKIGDPYMINELSILSNFGEPLTEIPNDTSFIVDVKLNKLQERNEKDYIFVAVYGTDGALLNLDYVKSQFAVDSECSFGFNVPPQKQAVGQVKAYIWHDFKSMTPLAETKCLTF